MIVITKLVTSTAKSYRKKYEYEIHIHQLNYKILFNKTDYPKVLKYIKINNGGAFHAGRAKAENWKILGVDFERLKLWLDKECL